LLERLGLVSNVQTPQVLPVRSGITPVTPDAKTIFEPSATIE